MFKCKYCGKEYETKSQLGGHIIWCKENPNRSGKCNFNVHRDKKRGVRNVNLSRDDLFCQYCGKQCKSINSLKQHEIRCGSNPNKIKNSFSSFNESIKNGEINVWNKGLTAKDSESVAKHSKSLSVYYETHNGPNKGTIMSSEQKENIRLGTINYIKSLKGDCKPRYNKKACSYINKLNEENKWNLQHAENGGEIEVGGYFLDGYDKKLNIVLEYNERKHYIDPFNNILTDKDIERNNYIKECLDCKFYIYNEFTNTLYEY